MTTDTFTRADLDILHPWGFNPSDTYRITVDGVCSEPWGSLTCRAGGHGPGRFQFSAEYTSRAHAERALRTFHWFGVLGHTATGRPVSYQRARLWDGRTGKLMETRGGLDETEAAGVVVHINRFRAARLGASYDAAVSA